MKTAALADYDLYLFHQGTNFHAYEMLGAHYTEQGGEVTHIGGKIVYDNGLLPNMSTADVTSDSAAKVRTTLNTLITNLKNAGLMVGDAFAMQYAAVTDSVSGHADRQYNTGKISSVAVDDDTHEITITLSDKVKNLKDFDGGNGWGVVRLYDKAAGSLRLVDKIEATHIGCEYGEYDGGD